MPRRFQAVRRRFLQKPMEEPESVIAGRFFVRLNELLARFNVTEKEYLDRVLPSIPHSQLWSAEAAERAIRKYWGERGR